MMTKYFLYARKIYVWSFGLAKDLLQLKAVNDLLLPLAITI